MTFDDEDYGEGFAFAHEFVIAVRRVESFTELANLLEAVTIDLGFRYYALIHHDDMREQPPGHIHLQNYPADYASRYIAGCYYRDDPVLHATHNTNVCIYWSDIFDFVPRDSKYRTFLERGAREGVYDGVTIPSAIHGECNGSLTLCSPRDPAAIRRRMCAIELVGRYSFEAARRLASDGRPRPIRAIRLQPRERQCLILAAMGCNDCHIARHLDLSPASIKYYLERARSRYRVVTRTQLLAAALFDAEVGLHELIPKQDRQKAG